MKVITEMKTTFKWTLSHREDPERECVGYNCWATLSTVFKGVLGRSPEKGRIEDARQANNDAPGWLLQFQLHCICLFPYSHSWMTLTLVRSAGKTPPPLCYRWGSKIGKIQRLVSDRKATEWPGGRTRGSSDSQACHSMWWHWHWLCHVGTIASCQSQHLTRCDCKLPCTSGLLRSSCRTDAQNQPEMKAVSHVNWEVNLVILSVSIHLFLAPRTPETGASFPKKEIHPPSPQATEGPQCSKSSSSHCKFLKEFLL